MDSVALHPTRCAICDTLGNASLILPAALGDKAFTPEVFSARRIPDRIHYCLVRCKSCGLIRSDPIGDPATIENLYTKSGFTYTEEIANLALTYGRYLRLLERYGIKKEALLEIGCGNGFFLEEALRQGYAQVQGVEPSMAAVLRAAPLVARHITVEAMRPGLFSPDSFSAVCLFQVLDHIIQPKPLLSEIHRLLKPGGMVLCIVHNVTAFSARILRQRSPIVDIEHTYFYSPPTLCRLFLLCGFTVEKSGSVANRYSLSYLARLLPSKSTLKQRLVMLSDNRAMRAIDVTLPLGNMYLIARKLSDHH